MISLVVCSIDPELLTQLKNNIASTIGVNYELLVWDNRNENKGLCEVYNMMAAKATFEFICFVHEDMEFQTQNWGKKLISVFEDNPEVGAIGVAGCKYKSGGFSGWYTDIKEADCCNIVHRCPWGDELIFLKPDETKMMEEVVCLDGVFICCRKQIHEAVKFDERNFPGFHFYDIDFSVNVARISTVLVTYEIDIIHTTIGGDFGEKWVNSCIDYHLLKKEKLPFTKLRSLPADIDKRIIKTWLNVLKNHKINWRNKWRWIALQKLYNDPALIYPILRFLLYQPMRVRFFHRKLKAWGKKKKKDKNESVYVDMHTNSLTNGTYFFDYI